MKNVLNDAVPRRIRPSFGWVWMGWVVLAWLGGAGPGVGQGAVRLQTFLDSAGRVVCSSEGPSPKVYRLERSRDLKEWREFGRAWDAFERFPLNPTGESGAAYFRLQATERTSDDDWKNQVKLSGDPLFSNSGSEGASGARWIKFCIRLDEPGRVYFQDGERYPFHYAFATRRLSGFEGMSAEEFDRISLHRAGQKLVLGAVLMPVDEQVREVGIQIVGREVFPVERVAEWLGWVRGSLIVPSDWSVFYFPTYEQGTVTESDREVLAKRGFQVGTPARWVRGDEVYSEGWAYGRLRVVAPERIATAYADGTLKPGDILVTEAVPAEIPMVAATLALTPSTPNSHVAILSQSFGAPFGFVADGELQSRLRAWDGQEAVVLAERGVNGDRLQVLRVDGVLSETQRQKLIAAKAPKALSVAPIEKTGQIAMAVRERVPSDVSRVGGKAANFGVLMRALPDHAPSPALAFTFDLWEAYLSRPGPGEGTLGQWIAAKLAVHTDPPDVGRLAKDLAEIREQIRSGTDFSQAQKDQILAALAEFPAGKKVRFRSSTNVEDSEQFSGAGLYDSYSGCVADDRDGDDAGPSACDASESGERGVFRALRRVYASFYNDNAFLARLRHRVDERTVGMAVLVHPSFPDETELANGVATFRVTRDGNGGAMSYVAEFVSQRGAVSVSNPEGNARPEVVSAKRAAGAGAPTFTRVRGSSLTPMGGSVLGWTGEYEELAGLLERAAAEFLKGRAEPVERVLDFEYKKVAPGRLVVKQVREVPTSDSAATPPPFSLSDAGRFEVFQHHGKDLWANHRLKSFWRFESLVFNDGSVGAGFDFFTNFEFHDGTTIRKYSGRLSGLPGARLNVSGKTLEVRWEWATGPLRGAYRWVATFPQTLNPAKPSPMGDAVDVQLSAQYLEPQSTLNFLGEVGAVTSHSTRLVPMRKIVEGSLARRLVARQRQVTVDVAYTLSFLKFGAPGIGIFDTKSFPLTAWRGATLTGLVDQPVRLTSSFSQTYDSIRHNFQETFLFEPGLEPGLDEAVREALRRANVRLVYLTQFTAQQGTTPEIRFMGFDGKWRKDP